VAFCNVYTDVYFISSQVTATG